MIEYVFDGTLTAPETGAQGHHVDVPGGEQLRQSVGFDVVGESEIGDASRTRLERLPRRTIAVDQERHLGECPSRLHHELERLREPDVARVEHHGPVTEPELLAVTRRPVGRHDHVGVDEVGDHVDCVDVAGGGQFGHHVVAQVVGQHRDGIGGLIAHPLEP